MLAQGGDHMIKDMKAVVDILQEAIENHGLLETMYDVFGGRVNVNLVFKEKYYEEDICMLGLSSRSINGLKRGGAEIIGDVIDLVKNGSLMDIRNLGKKSAMEIKGALLNYAYEHMTENEKRKFLHDVLRRNGMSD